MSWKYIYWQWTNTIEQPCIQNEEFCQEFREFLKNNTVFVKAVATEKDKTDPFWHQVNYTNSYKYVFTGSWSNISL